MRVALALLLVPALLLAGCSDSSSDSPVAPGPLVPAGNATVAPVVHTVSGTVTVGVGTPALSFTSGADQLDFAVPANATLLFAELRWSSAVQALDLCVHAPADGTTQGVPNCGVVGDGGQPGMPKGLVQVSVAMPEKGEGWSISVYGKAVNADQAYDLAVTIFAGESAVPDGYTAFG